MSITNISIPRKLDVSGPNKHEQIVDPDQTAPKEQYDQGLLFLPAVLQNTPQMKMWISWTLRMEESISDMAYLSHFILETPKGVLAKSADPDQMPHNVASDLGLHYFASFSAIFQQKYIN